MTEQEAPAPVVAPPAPRPRRLTLDNMAKVIGLVVAMIGVGKYYTDRTDAQANAARARSLSFIETYASNPLLGAREQLYGFWTEQPELVQIFGNETLNARQYGAMLSATVFRRNGDDAIRQPLILLDNFYSQINFCDKGGLCDPVILRDYFCATSRRNAVAYGPFYARLAERTGDSSLGADLQSFAAGCPA